MKKIPLFLFIISIFGYAQTITLPATQDRFPQEILDKMNPNALTSQVNEFSDINQIKNTPSQTFQREVSDQDENYNLRLDGEIMINDGVWDTVSQSFVANLKTEITYNENRSRTLNKTCKWDSESQSFVERSKYEYAFNSNGKLTLSIYYYWNSVSQSSVLNSKNEYAYNSNGNMTHMIGYNWDTISQSFVAERKSEYAYNANGNRTLNISYNWDTISQSFVADWKYEYAYNANGNMTLSTSYKWDTESQSFVERSKYEYAYNANGNLTLYIGYKWDTESQSFVERTKYEYAYNANGNGTLDIIYKWDTESQSFVADWKYEYAYNANGNMTLSTSYNWDTESQSFVAERKNEYAYDANNFKTNETSYNWYPQFGFYKPNFKTDISIKSETDTNLVREGINYKYDTNFNTWNELEGEKFKSYWYYTKESSMSTDIVELNSFTIYPNPTENMLFISGSKSPLTISIYNMLGKEVFSINNTDNINVQALPKGAYAIRITDGVNQTNRKFIKN